MTFFTQARMTALAVLVFCSSAQADDITGAGSTFVFPILAKWSGEYSAKTGTKLDYQPIGSGRGIVQIKATAVDFGASDAPLKPEDLRKSDLGQFPLVIGGIVPVVNIEGVKPGEIRFTGALLADIFLGKVKRWNDPEITKLNPEVGLPAAAIAVVHRSDSSGTTFNWVNYLSKASPEWRDKVGEGTAVAWPTGAGGKGNEGVAALVMQTRNSIGYVDYAHVLRNSLLPIVTAVGLELGFLLGGSVITETIFGWPGVGREIVSAIGSKDFYVVQAGVIMLALMFAGLNLLVDMLERGRPQ